MKTINLELSKRLAPYLQNIDTEYSIYNILMSNGGKGITVLNEIEKKYFIKEQGDILQKIYKTLIIKEVIEFLPRFLYDNDGNMEELHIKKTIDNEYEIYYRNIFNTKNKNTLLEAIEKMIEYLLDNNLLEKGKNAI